MKLLLAMSFLTTTANECEDLKKDIIALEFFLQDKKDHKDFCPELKWEQPKPKTYRDKPKSYLPEECKKDKSK
tara:strand:- start:181 stop:399 length:219 start_codon:yes stop_codon:yes gene_type:complete